MHGAHANDLASGTRHFGHHPAAQKLTHRGPRAQKLPRQVHTQDGIPLRQRHLVKGGIALQTGIGDESVDGPELTAHMREHVVDLRFR